MQEIGMKSILKGEQIKEANAETFGNLSDEYAKDWKYFYYNGEIIKDTDVNSFQIILKKIFIFHLN